MLLTLISIKIYPGIIINIRDRDRAGLCSVCHKGGGQQRRVQEVEIVPEV